MWEQIHIECKILYFNGKYCGENQKYQVHGMVHDLLSFGSVLFPEQNAANRSQLTDLLVLIWQIGIADADADADVDVDADTSQAKFWV